MIGDGAIFGEVDCFQQRPASYGLRTIESGTQVWMISSKEFIEFIRTSTVHDYFVKHYIPSVEQRYVNKLA